MPVTMTFRYMCDVCGRESAVVALDGRNGRAPEGWIVSYGVNMDQPSAPMYICEIHSVEVHKTTENPDAKAVIRDSEDAKPK